MRTWLLAFAVLVAGCTTDLPEQEEDPAPGHSFAPQTGHDEAQGGKTGGLHLEGDLSECDAGFCLDVTASNRGDATYHISSMCAPPWSEAMRRDGDAVQHREPMAYCMAFGTAPFAPGAERSAQFAWNGTLWNDAAQRYERAPADAYEWTIHFVAYEEADGAGKHELAVSFTVLVDIAT